MKKRWMRKIRTVSVSMIIGSVITLSGVIQPVCAAERSEDTTNNYVTEATDSQDITLDSSDSNSDDGYVKEKMQAFLDAYFEENMGVYETPGVAVAVVKDSQELLTRAYGYADLASGEEVNVDTTTFPACSVSKLFTATAIMQLSEQGKIDLNADIRDYLDDIEIKNCDTPITCASLLTHSSGLDEESELNGSTLDQSQILSQGEYFKNHIPTVIREPGTVSCYSNMGYNLLGYVVEKVSGQSYEDYIQDQILSPLQMDSASVRIENEQMATGYEDQGNGNEEQGFAYQYTSGSSGVITTVRDMEHFMIMHLNSGAYQGQTILGEATEQEMQDKQFANASVYDGMGYGWIRDSYNGHQIIKHEGALPGYTTTLLLLPEEGIGVYVATNSTTGICFDFEEAFLNYLYGEQAFNLANLPIVTADQKELNQFTGTYRSYDGIGQTNIMKLGMLFDDTDLTVTMTQDGGLKAVLYNQEKEREETLLDYCGDGVFAREDGKGYLTFRLDDNGAVEYAFTGVSHCTYEKCRILESKPVLLAGLGTIPLMILIAFVLFIQLLRRKYCNILIKRYKAGTMIGNLMGAISVIAAVVLELVMIMNYQYQSIWILKLLLILILISVMIMLGTNGYGIYLIGKKMVRRKEAVWIGLIGCIQVLFTIEMVYFQMIGLHIY